MCVSFMTATTLRRSSDSVDGADDSDRDRDMLLAAEGSVLACSLTILSLAVFDDVSCREQAISRQYLLMTSSEIFSCGR